MRATGPAYAALEAEVLLAVADALAEPEPRDR